MAQPNCREDGQEGATSTHPARGGKDLLRIQMWSLGLYVGGGGVLINTCANTFGKKGLQCHLKALSILN